MSMMMMTTTTMMMIVVVVVVVVVMVMSSCIIMIICKIIRIMVKLCLYLIQNYTIKACCVLEVLVHAFLTSSLRLR